MVWRLQGPGPVRPRSRDPRPGPHPALHLTSRKLQALAAGLRDGHVDLALAQHQLHVAQPVAQAGEQQQPGEVPGAEAEGHGQAAAAWEAGHLYEVVRTPEVDGVWDGVQAPEGHLALQRKCGPSLGRARAPASPDPLPAGAQQ